jgi:hypothetical protein
VAAALCAVNTYWGIAFLALVQISFAVAPRLFCPVPH